MNRELHRLLRYDQLQVSETKQTEDEKNSQVCVLLDTIY